MIKVGGKAMDVKMMGDDTIAAEDKLWRERAGHFWRGFIPYLQYVASSGLALFLFVFFIVAVHYYNKLLDHVPTHFPANWLAMLCLLPALAFNPVRTFFREPDLIYLLPAEHRLQRYIRQTLILSLVVQTMLTAVIWLVIWPLYRVTAGVGTIVFWQLLAVLFIMKWTSLISHWQEQQLQYEQHRTAYRATRWMLTAAMLYMLFTYSLALSTLVIGVTLIIYVIALRLPAKFTLNWQHLIAVEERQVAKYYTFLSWFVDPPAYESKMKPRRYLNWVTNRLPFSQSNAYRYLYVKTFLRSPIFGIVMRLLTIGFIVVYGAGHVLVKGFIFIFFSYMIGVQLSALAQQHRFSFWLKLYPIPQSKRSESVKMIITRLHVVAVGVLFIAVWLSLGMQMAVFYILCSGVMLLGWQKFRFR